MAKLVIGDLHAPFDLPNYLRFLKRLKREHDIDEVISIGDLTDQHTISRFLNHPEAWSTKKEWQKAVERLKRYSGELGLSKAVIGNHDTRIIKKSREADLPDEWIRPIEELYGLQGVEFAEEFFIDGVLYIHGVSAGGESGWQDYSRKNGCSTVFGHYHSVAGVRYHQMRNNKLLFSAATGCGIDTKRYAFEYAKGTPKLPVVGAVVVYNSSKAYFEPFDPTDRKNIRKD